MFSRLFSLVRRPYAGRHRRPLRSGIRRTGSRRAVLSLGIVGALLVGSTVAAPGDNAWLNFGVRGDVFDIQVARAVDGIFSTTRRNWMQAASTEGVDAAAQCATPLRPGGPACEFDLDYINASGTYGATFAFALQEKPGTTASPLPRDSLRFDLSYADGKIGYYNQTWAQMQDFREYMGGDVLTPMQDMRMHVRMWIPAVGLSAGQSWTHWADGTIRNGLGLCLDADLNPLTQKNSKILAYECHGGSNQRWTYTAVNGAIRSVGADMCLAWGEGQPNIGSSIVLWPCNNSYTQNFLMPNLLSTQSANVRAVDSPVKNGGIVFAAPEGQTGLGFKGTSITVQIKARASSVTPG